MNDCVSLILRTVFYYTPLYVWLSGFVQIFALGLMKWALMVFVIGWHKAHHVALEDF